MMDCKPVTTSRILTFRSYMVVMSDQTWEMPQSFKNSFALMFFMNLRPNICFAVSIVSSYLVEPHWIDARNLLRCLQDTISHGLRYTSGDVRILGYTDVDWAGSVVDRKSTSQCCFTLGFASISWMSRKQKSVALSTAEAGYIVASMTSCEAVWLRKLFIELFGFTLDTTVILYNNQRWDSIIEESRIRRLLQQINIIWDMVI